MNTIKIHLLVTAHIILTGRPLCKVNKPVGIRGKLNACLQVDLTRFDYIGVDRTYLNLLKLFPI